MREIDRLEELGVDGRINSKGVLEKVGCGAWTGMNLFRIRTCHWRL